MSIICRGGNYFMVGGFLNGGKILGTYPSPLGPESDYWLKRGRWIPTTPWEAVFNALGQWLGIHSDDGLDWALPNRQSFSTCSLFSDKDLFIDGACQCVEANGIESTVCDDLTYCKKGALFLLLVHLDVYKLTLIASLTAPTISPSTSPTFSPSTSPTVSPTVELPYDGVYVSNIL